MLQPLQLPPTKQAQQYQLERIQRKSTSRCLLLKRFLLHGFHSCRVLSCRLIPPERGKEWPAFNPPTYLPLLRRCRRQTLPNAWFSRFSFFVLSAAIQSGWTSQWPGGWLSHCVSLQGCASRSTSTPCDPSRLRPSVVVTRRQQRCNRVLIPTGRFVLNPFTCLLLVRIVFG